MKILIELPTWLGDTIMTTPAIENIVKEHPDVKITLFGSFVSIEILKKHPNVVKTILDDSKKANFRFINLYKKAKSLGEFDKAFSFRRTLSSRFFLFCISSKNRFGYKRYIKEQIHQVQRYNDFVNRSLGSDYVAADLKLYYKPKQFSKPTLGINPGATYGSAKRWYPDRFAEVAYTFASKYDIVIFGGENEIDMAKDIETALVEKGVKNFTNLAGATSIVELTKQIAGLSLFITGDSGPMHIAAAYKIPSICLFGPTKCLETSQWKNPFGKIVRFELECSPCMKRECPLGTHECMKLIEADMVIKEVQDIINQKYIARKN